MLVLRPHRLIVARFFLWRVALLCLLLAPEFRAQTQSFAPPRDTDAKLSVRIFDDVWQTINDRYYDPARLDALGWRELRLALRPLAAEAQTDEEMYGILRRLTGALGDSHTRAFRPGEADDWRRLRFISIGVSLVEADGRLFIAKVEDGTGARAAGVRRGDEVIAIDGRAWRDLLRIRTDENIKASTVRAGRLQAIRQLLEGEAGTTVEVELANRAGRRRTVKLSRAVREVRPELRVKPLGNETYLVAFNMFTGETVAEFARELRRGRLMRAERIVVDLRGNGGGEAEAMIDLLGVFLSPRHPLGRFVDRRGSNVGVLQTRAAMISATEQGIRFAGRVMLLTGAATGSAAEIFADAMKTAGRAKVVGGGTCGCVLAVRRRHKLPDGGTLYVSELDYRTSDDRRLEGEGVTPDEEVTLTRTDLLEDRDPTLERARKLLRAP